MEQVITEGHVRIIAKEETMKGLNDAGIKTMADDVSQIKRALLGDKNYSEEGLVNEHKQMWEDYIFWKKAMTLLGIGNVIEFLGLLATVIYLILERRGLV